MKPEAGIYIPVEKLENEKPDYNRVSKTKNSIMGALAKAHLKKLNINTFKFSKNLNLQGKTEFAQRYAVGALTKIINGQPVTNRTMLDSLFNTYAPAFNATLEQTGYNSIMQMKDAAMAGNINVTSFLTGFSNGLNAVQEERDFLYRTRKYGQEIPIDIVARCDYTYDMKLAEHPILTGKDVMDYIKDLGVVNIVVSGHVKNDCAQIWSMNDFSNRIVDAMLKKKPVVFRIGKTIYENIIIEKYEPWITNIYDIEFKLTLKYKYNFGRESRIGKKGLWIVNSGLNNRELQNLLAEPEFIGEGLVEKVTEDDLLYLGELGQQLGIGINGQTL